MLVEQSYGFDVGVVDESVDSLTQTNRYDVVMKRVFANTGSDFDRLRYYLFGFNSVTNRLFLSMSYRDYVDSPTNNISDFNARDIVDGFFSLDVQNVISDRIDYLVFKDYCFTTTGYYFQVASPNGKILALSSDSKIAFLNLETGYISYLPNWRFIGWAKR